MKTTGIMIFITNGNGNRQHQHRAARSPSKAPHHANPDLATSNTTPTIMIRSLIDELVVDPAFAIALALAGALAPVLVNVGSIPSWARIDSKTSGTPLEAGRSWSTGW